MEKRNLPLIITDHLISDHKPNDLVGFSFYLAGLVQGCGRLEKKDNSLILKIPGIETTLAYYLKKKIGYGQLGAKGPGETHLIIKDKGLSIVNSLIKNRTSGFDANPLWNYGFAGLFQQELELFAANSRRLNLSQRGEGTRFTPPLPLPGFGEPVSGMGSFGPHPQLPYAVGLYQSSVCDPREHIIVDAKGLGCTTKLRFRERRVKRGAQAMIAHLPLPITNSAGTRPVGRQTWGAINGSENWIRNKIQRPYSQTKRNYWFTGFLDGIVKPEDIKLSLKTSILNQQRGGVNSFHPSPADIFFEVNASKECDPGFVMRATKVVAKRLPWSRQYESLSRLICNYLGIANRRDFDLHESRFDLLRIKIPFPNKIIRQIIWHLDHYPFISSKYIKYIKYRKIYRICQRKEHFKKKGLLKILSIWRSGLI